jgi:hypothetical protein
MLVTREDDYQRNQGRERDYRIDAAIRLGADRFDQARADTLGGDQKVRRNEKRRQ